MGLAADERNPFLYYSLEIEAPVKRIRVRIRVRWGGPFLAPVGADETTAAIGFVTFIFGLGQMRSNAPDLFRPDRPSRPVGRLRGHFAPRNPFPRLFDVSILAPRSA